MQASGSGSWHVKIMATVALERQDVSRTYLAYHELESVVIIIAVIIIFYFLFFLYYYYYYYHGNSMAMAWQWHGNSYSLLMSKESTLPWIDLGSGTAFSLKCPAAFSRSSGVIVG